MNELVEFLRARLDEDDRAARAATAGPWRHSSDKHHHEPGTPRFSEAVFAGAAGKAATCVATTGETDDPQSMADAAYIARQDPARVLREVEAKRTILAMHAPSERTEYGAQVCSRCSDLSPCDTLRLLALPYSDHPDYDESWRP